MAEATVKVVLNLKGFDELRRSPEVEAEVKRRAVAIAASAGDGYEADVSLGKTRARASVRTTDILAIVDESQNHTLERALHSGGHA